MVSNRGDGQSPRITASVPTNHKQALDYVATKRSNPGNRKYTADVVRDAIREYFANHFSELPPEARDILDDDFASNAGSSEVTVEVEGASGDDVAESIEGDRS